MKAQEAPKVVQLALATADIAGSLRLYVEGLGFANSGSSAIWGDMMALHGLDPDARAIMWWMVGRQEYFQIELFAHGNPPQRELPADWRVSDQGWVRFTIAVSDLDAVLERLPACGVTPPAPVVDSSGTRRTAFRDPYAGCFVEVLEDRAGTKAPARHFDIDAAVISVTASVLDFEGTCDLYANTIGLERLAPDALHTPDHESLWGLEAARREMAVFRAGTINIEIVHYTSPEPRPLPVDHRTSDQGVINVCLGWRDWHAMRATVDRLVAAGCTLTAPVDHPPIGVTYINEPDRLLELLAVPADLDAAVGFAPVAPLLATGLPDVDGGTEQ